MPGRAPAVEESGGRRQERSLGLYLLCTTDITLIIRYCPQHRTMTQDTRVIINFNPSVLIEPALYHFSSGMYPPLSMFTQLLLSCHVTKYSRGYSYAYPCQYSRCSRGRVKTTLTPNLSFSFLKIKIFMIECCYGSLLFHENQNQNQRRSQKMSHATCSRNKTEILLSQL